MKKHLIMVVEEDEKDGGGNVVVDIESVSDNELYSFVLMALDSVYRTIYKDHSKKSADRLRMVIKHAVNDPKSPLFDLDNAVIEH